MSYHQAWSARFIGHCGGRGWRDATENLLQTSVINHLGALPLRRICGKSITLKPLIAIYFRWGRSYVGDGWQGKNKQTKRAGSWTQQTDKDTEKSSLSYFFVLKTRGNMNKYLHRMHPIHFTKATHNEGPCIQFAVVSPSSINNYTTHYH